MFYQIIQFFKDIRHGETLGSAMGRSPLWPKARADYLKLHPVCEITGSTKKLIIHHKKPFHLYPELELNPTNFIALSEDVFGSNIHLVFGHLGNYKKFNPDIEKDAAIWKQKLSTRP